jgi:hypothetical protein
VSQFCSTEDEWRTMASASKAMLLICVQITQTCSDSIDALTVVGNRRSSIDTIS